jgi:endonuclease YncB( thermonuclease family)
VKETGEPERRLYGVFSAFLMATAFVFAPHAQALQDFHARVVRVTDGDTIVVEDADGFRHKVRIVSIDAPEKGRRAYTGQAYAERARLNLARLVEDRPVFLDARGLDDYGRVLARVWVGGARGQGGFDVGLAQVCAGYAWFYEAFASTLATADQKAYRACQTAAMDDKLGLWRATNPVPPWVWRHTGSGAQEL